ncbi:hypothetical protein FW778_14720 [Ginsengibacter hankyongi]|uniref:Uncharacterized protein n=1 Tax=Ginsengibacter hankyongi TaxID=2607284 RepID=A0A5J5IDX5_9BACT|nr:hypothetical protein [Ginsengibacter hankyongi]KAA9038017.1 hypothetical protein FW778_14720 [Ginsengibacter hankyongi]
MAINKNHLFEELDGVKCGIVEKEVSADRASFLKNLLEYNNFNVIVVPAPPPKAVSAAVVKAADGTIIPSLPPPPVPETFTVGVTDYTFNPINAIFGRLLKTPDGHVVTLAYWEQKETVSHDEVPYYETSH